MDEEQQSVDEMALVRELARRAYPDAVAELIDGGSAEEITASIEPARAAYARLKAEIEAARPVTAAQVPAGGMSPAIDPDRLPAAEKIRRGLATSLTRS
jgi:hypothetical protein